MIKVEVTHSSDRRRDYETLEFDSIDHLLESYDHPIIFFGKEDGVYTVEVYDEYRE